MASKNCLVMSEQELNAYRFSPEQEPTDEMLEQIMKEVAKEARESNRKATEEHWARMLQDIAAKQKQWGDKISALAYGRK